MAQDIPSWQVVGVNRTDRLYAIVELLRATAPRARAARDLADRFEVSVRTIERDVSSLQQSGVPIWATPGPGGGYSVDPSMSLPPLNFSAGEATATAVASSAQKFSGGRLMDGSRSEEHTSELQSQSNLVCRLLLEKKNRITRAHRRV